MLKLFTFLVKTQNIEPKKIFVLDCDAIDTFKKMDSIKTNFLIPFIFNKNNENVKIPKGIENLFNQSLFENRFYDKKIESIEYGGTKEINTFNKNKFEDYICNERSNVEDFENFIPLIEKLKELI